MEIPAARLSSAALALWFAALVPSFAVNEKGDWPWNLKLNGWHDSEVAEELKTGWFLNVGPTGIRARITHEHPEYLTVKYVFKKSPAAGIVNIDDIIVGANGKRLTVEHTFGRRATGWDGPMLDMSKLIEDSQGKDGKLELIIWPGGVKAEEKTVTVQIEAVGRFSETWPFDCPRSDKLMTDLCDFLVEDYKRAGKFESQVHTHGSCVLALMASGDGKYDGFIKDVLSDYGSRRYDSTDGEGFKAWGQVHDGIVMGEWYLLKKDRRLLPAMESLADCLNDSVWPETGGLSHRPFAAIQRRMAEGGPKGYGAMALPAGLGMVGLSLFKEAGLPYAEPSYQRIHEAFLCSVKDSGAIDYGFNIWDHAVIDLENPKGAPKNSPRGIGYECLEGMDGIGKYSIIWPTKSDPRYKPTDWLDKEMETNRVFDMGKGKRMVVRNMSPEEPTKAYSQNGGQCDHHARSGAGALAHAIGNEGNKSWGYLSELMATGCAKSGKGLLDGHASTHMHVLWGSLGAAMAEEKDFREYLENIRWWMIMAQAHDGSYVVMPGRDYASTDHAYGGRAFPTACASLILSVKDKRLRITGAPSGGSAANAAKASAARPARTLPAEKKRLLDRGLLLSLGEFANSGSPAPVGISKASSKVLFGGVQEDSKLVFRAAAGQSKAAFEFNELTGKDHAALAVMIAQGKPADTEAQATAGIYLELAGETAAADGYYAKAGDEFVATLGELFE